MASTYTSLHYHLVFSTKERRRWILPVWKTRLMDYLGGIVRDLEGVPNEINGTNDHIHLLVSLKPTHQLSDVLRQIKGGSSGWVHAEIGQKEFAWQDGYGAFTVSPTQMAGVRKYIQKQEAHHDSKTFKEEYIELLKMSGVKYDGKYL